jgi:hypothetical protein
VELRAQILRLLTVRAPTWCALLVFCKKNCIVLTVSTETQGKVS